MVKCFSTPPARPGKSVMTVTCDVGSRREKASTGSERNVGDAAATTGPQHDHDRMMERDRDTMRRIIARGNPFQSWTKQTARSADDAVARLSGRAPTRKPIRAL